MSGCSWCPFARDDGEPSTCSHSWFCDHPMAPIPGYLGRENYTDDVLARGDLDRPPAVAPTWCPLRTVPTVLFLDEGGES